MPQAFIHEVPFNIFCHSFSCGPQKDKLKSYLPLPDKVTLFGNKDFAEVVISEDEIKRQ